MSYKSWLSRRSGNSPRRSNAREDSEALAAFHHDLADEEVTMSRNNDNSDSDEALIEIAAVLHRESPRAWLIDDGDRRDWVPKSQVTRASDETWLMPEWLAMEKGFI